MQKQREIAERTSAFCEFLVELTSAALGGKSGDKDEIGLDTGEGVDELTDEQLANLKAMLGETDFMRLYRHLV